jgi:hypothetical protein
MRTHSLLAISFGLACFTVGAGAGCGGEVSSAQDNGESRAAAATENGCPQVAPQQGTTCPTDGARCDYPVDQCTLSYLCKCTTDRGWVCEMPAECVSR